ncbi:hypothetical protein NPX79_01305 [Spiroplasma endosymbiont of Anurida maritima]|uniref:hypothetical protein n=1 Tax=Spiroplasma endosymbiont of Anurida maritima TaxID=2967972 RepID=UPI0036D2C0A8
MKFNFKKNLVTMIFVIISTVLLSATVVLASFLLSEKKKSENYQLKQNVQVNFHNKEQKIISDKKTDTKYATLEELLLSPVYEEAKPVISTGVYRSFLNDAYNIIDNESNWYLMLYSDTNKSCKDNEGGMCDVGISFLYLEDNDVFDIKAEYYG